jgi:hypothetical protein
MKLMGPASKFRSWFKIPAILQVLTLMLKKGAYLGLHQKRLGEQIMDRFTFQ